MFRRVVGRRGRIFTKIAVSVVVPVSVVMVVSVVDLTEGIR